MGTASLAISVGSCVLVGLGTFLYNDGHDHRVIGGMHAILGVIGTVVGIVLWVTGGVQEYHCYTQGSGCVPLWRTVWEDLGGPPVTEFLAALGSGYVGYRIAKWTARRPHDDRPPTTHLDDIDR
jgi:hypothetical protein